MSINWKLVLRSVYNVTFMRWLFRPFCIATFRYLMQKFITDKYGIMFAFIELR